VATIDVGREEGECCCAPIGGEGAAGSPSNTVATIDMGRKLGAVHLLGGAASPSNTTSLGRGLPPYCYELYACVQKTGSV